MINEENKPEGESTEATPTPAEEPVATVEEVEKKAEETPA